LVSLLTHVSRSFIAQFRWFLVRRVRCRVPDTSAALPRLRTRKVLRSSLQVVSTPLSDFLDMVAGEGAEPRLPIAFRPTRRNVWHLKFLGDVPGDPRYPQPEVEQNRIQNFPGGGVRTLKNWGSDNSSPLGAGVLKLGSCVQYPCPTLSLKPPGSPVDIF
jgi:hypothetical protein